jgi:hypothetical protein
MNGEGLAPHPSGARREELMAKSKETSTPLISALVFFVLTTIAFGVMWYLAYSDTETHVNAKKNAEKDLAGVRAAKDEAERLARVYRIYMGVPRGAPEDDVNVINTEAKANDKIAAELKQINDAVARKVAGGDGGTVPDEFKFWQVDAGGKAGPAPDKGLTDLFAAMKNREAAYKAADDERANYRKQIDAITQDQAALKKAAADLKAASDNFPANVKKQVQDVVDAFDRRTKQYQQAEAAANKAVEETKGERDRLDRELRQERNKVAKLAEDNQRLLSERAGAGQESLTYDEPQGKILRKLPENVVEINLGSAAGVRPGLTFTVLPSDFPAKGRQSRMRAVRVPDGKGGFKSVEQFVPRGAIEVFEVVNERLSLARVQSGSEVDPIRDGITQGDLLYNSAWRKGVADHIALVGIFDVNGDASTTSRAWSAT